MKKNITLALIHGGRGYESEVSLGGKGYIYPILKEDYNILPVFIDKAGRWLIEEREVFPYHGGFLSPNDGLFFDCDCALPLLHGDYGEDGIVQGALCCANIPYVGCESTVGAICRDKAVVKAVAERLNIPTLPYVLFKEGDNIEIAEGEIGYPMFIKPTSLGSSFGASPARDREGLHRALDTAFSHSKRVMIERLIEPKRELECGFFSVKGKELFTNPGEILSDGLFYDYESKYKECGFKTRDEADVDGEICRLIKEYSSRLVRFLGIKQLARIDFFLSEGRLYFNEINTMPGMTETSLYLKMLSRQGLGVREALGLLIEDAISISR